MRATPLGRFPLVVAGLMGGLMPMPAPAQVVQAEPRWVNMSPEGRLVAKKLAIEGGFIEAHGGLVVLPLILKPLFGKLQVIGDKISVEIGLRLINRSPNTVWLEFEVQTPGTSKFDKQKKELKSGIGWWRFWKPDGVEWDTPYPVSIAVFADKKLSKPLGSVSTSFVFESGDRPGVENAVRVAGEQLRKGQPVCILISGWPEKMSPEELAAVKKREEERNPVPPFEWNEKEGSQGASLTAVESKRPFGPKGDKFIEYDFHASGFAPREELTVWIRWADGKFMKIPFPVVVDEKGVVQGWVEGKPVGFHSTLGKIAPGEPIAWALVSASGQRAYARAVPYPLESRGAGGCSASAELQTASGLLFLATLRGFSPGEEVEITSEYKDEKKAATQKADEHGEISMPILFGEGDRGKATLKAAGRDCNVSLTYKVGPDAQVPQ